MLFLHVSLDSVEESDNELTYRIAAYGKNVLCFRSFSWNISIENENQQGIEFKRKQSGNLSYIEFTGQGSFIITMVSPKKNSG